jgi:FKBP-type peptidyl-prolyl cis-trans isomerase FkpA
VRRRLGLVFALAGLSAGAPAVFAAKRPPVQIIPEHQRLCTLKTATGLGYKILRAANGTSPTRNDFVVVHYIGYFARTGRIFDQNEQAIFPVDGVIPGFSEGLTMMQKGSIYRFCIPARLGYGGKEAGPVPPNSNLIFQVELLDFKTKAEVEAIRKAQQAKPPK